MRKECVYEGQCCLHASSIDGSGEMLVCNDGKWEKKMSARSGLMIALGEGMWDI